MRKVARDNVEPASIADTNLIRNLIRFNKKFKYNNLIRKLTKKKFILTGNFAFTFHCLKTI